MVEFFNLDHLDFPLHTPTLAHAYIFDVHLIWSFISQFMLENWNNIAHLANGTLCAFTILLLLAFAEALMLADYMVITMHVRKLLLFYLVATCGMKIKLYILTSVLSIFIYLNSFHSR